MCDKWTIKFALKVTYTSVHGGANNLADHSICVSYKGTEVWECLLRDRMDYESSKKLAAQVLGLHLKIDDMLRGFSTVFSNTYGRQLDEELRIFLSLYTSDLRWGLSTHQTTGRYWSSPSITQFVCPIRVQMFGHLLRDTMNKASSN